MTQAAEVAWLSPGQLGLERLFWAVSDAVFVGDARSGRIVLWNPAAERLFGYTADEATGLPLDVLVPDGLSAVDHNGLATPVELVAVDKAGQQHWVELALTPLTRPDTSDLMFVAITRDLSHRKPVEVERGPPASLSAAVASALAQGATLAQALDACATALCQLIEGSDVRIWTLSETEPVLELQASTRTLTPRRRNQKRMRVASTDIGKIAAARILRVMDRIPHTREWQWATRAGFAASPGLSTRPRLRCHDLRLQQGRARLWCGRDRQARPSAQTVGVISVAD
jgi:PAS domain S-box-containing protein